MEVKKKWYQTDWGVIALLVLFFPVGLYLMWKHMPWTKNTKWIVTAIFIALIIFSAMSDNTSTPAVQPSEQTQSQATQAPTQTIEVSREPTQVIVTTPPVATKVPVKATVTTAPAQSKQSAPASNGTVSQGNAVRSAKSYISFSGFSHDGLVAQLEFEKYSHEDAVYGADNSGANWNEEAAQSAKSYTNMSGFSREGLIQQLLFEKFTQAQAEYGANAVGL